LCTLVTLLSTSALPAKTQFCLLGSVTLRQHKVVQLVELVRVIVCRACAAIDDGASEGSAGKHERSGQQQLGRQDSVCELFWFVNRDHCNFSFSFELAFLGCNLWLIVEVVE